MLKMDLLAIRQCLTNCSNHEIRWIGPWLRGMDNNTTEQDTRFFPDFSSHSFFN
jgi:hypothetical protein